MFRPAFSAGGDVKSIVFVIFAFVLVAAGCDRTPEKPANCGPETGAQASCWYEKGCWDLQCEEINKNGTCFTSEGEARMKKICEKEQKGVFYFGCTCPRENSIGGCQNGRQKDRLITTWVYGKNWSADEYRNVCESTAYDRYIEP